MTRIDIDIDDDLLEAAMRKYGLASPSEAVDLALRRLVGTPVTKEFLLSLEGMGWEGDLDELRNSRVESLDDLTDDQLERLDEIIKNRAERSN
jgi:Arc/MetJ family transcription regulator